MECQICYCNVDAFWFGSCALMEAMLVELAMKAGVKERGKDRVQQQVLMANGCNRAGVTVWQRMG